MTLDREHAPDNERHGEEHERRGDRRHGEAHDGEQLLDKADHALGIAEHAGRPRVHRIAEARLDGRTSLVGLLRIGQDVLPRRLGDVRAFSGQVAHSVVGEDGAVAGIEHGGEQPAHHEAALLAVRPVDSQLVTNAKTHRLRKVSADERLVVVNRQTPCHHTRHQRKVAQARERVALAPEAHHGERLLPRLLYGAHLFDDPLHLVEARVGRDEGGRHVARPHAESLLRRIRAAERAAYAEHEHDECTHDQRASRKPHVAALRRYDSAHGQPQTEMGAAQRAGSPAAERHVGRAAPESDERRDARELVRLAYDDGRDQRQQRRQKEQRRRRRRCVRRQHAGELREERQDGRHERPAQPEAGRESQKAHAHVLHAQHAAQRAVRQAEGLERAVVRVILLDGRRDGVRADDERYHEQQQREHAQDGAADDHDHHGIAGKRVGGEHARCRVRPGHLICDEPGEVGRGRARRACLVRQAHVDLGHAIRRHLRRGRKNVGRFAALRDGCVDERAHLVVGSLRHHVTLHLQKRRAKLRILEEARDGEATRLVAHQHFQLVAYLNARSDLERRRHVDLVGARLESPDDETRPVVGEQAEAEGVAPSHERGTRGGVLVHGLAAHIVEPHGNGEGAVQPRLAYLGQRLHLGGHLVSEARRHIDGIHVARPDLGKRDLLAGVQVRVHAHGEGERSGGEGHEQEDARERALPPFEAGRDERAHERHLAPPTKPATTARRSPGRRGP